jgi:hypothetical protein
MMCNVVKESYLREDKRRCLTAVHAKPCVFEAKVRFVSMT